MIRTQSDRQLSLPGFDWPFQTVLDRNNRWVKMSHCIPWDELAEVYYEGLSSTQGRPAKEARLVIGAVIIKHKLCLSDREAIAQIQENPYLQFFVGLPGYQMRKPFAPSLFVAIRQRMQSVFDVFYDAVIDAVEKARHKPVAKGQSKAKPSASDESPPPVSDGKPQSDPVQPGHQGKRILDATAAPQAIQFPTDLGLLNEARELSEQIIDPLYAKTELIPPNLSA